MAFIDDLGRLTEAWAGVAAYWPLMEQAVTLEGINTPRVRAGVAATVCVEVYGFAPVVAARVLASYFKHTSGLVAACEQEKLA